MTGMSISDITAFSSMLPINSPDKKTGKKKEVRYTILPLICCLLRSDVLLDLSCLTNSVTQVVELSTANFTASDDLNLVNRRRMYREYSLDTAAVSNSADSECLADAAVLLSDNSTLEYLDSGLVTFNDLNMYLYRVTDIDNRHLGFQT